MKYPPRQFGYPPKIRDIDQKMLGLTSQSLNDLTLPIQQHIRNRSANLKSNENLFHEHAKSGFEYWLKDRRIPENNKPRGKYKFQFKMILKYVNMGVMLSDVRIFSQKIEDHVSHVSIN